MDSHSAHGMHDHHNHHHGMAPAADVNSSAAAWGVSDSTAASTLPGAVNDAPMTDQGHAGHHMGHNHGSHGSGMAHDMSGMAMAFHFGFTELILFNFWQINTLAGLLGSMVGIFLMSMMYEGLKVFREYLLQLSLQLDGVALNSGGAVVGASNPGGSNNGLRVPLAGEGDSGPDNVMAVKTYFRPNPLSWWHALQTALHMLQMAISYLLMLIFMTYNVWLCLAVVLGAGCGYYAFGWRKRTIVDINEHCH